MGLYGQTEVVYYQLTPLGVSRLQSGKFPTNLGSSEKRVLRDFQELGGTAEWDELKMMDGANPQVLSVSLNRLVDLGYVTTVGVEG